MKEQDPLNSLLREWQAPEPSPALDARVRAAVRESQPLPWWRRIWTARITIPVPALAALLLVAAALWLQLKPKPPVTAKPSGEYVTRIESAGFRPLPDGESRVIRKEGAKQ